MLVCESSRQFIVHSCIEGLHVLPQIGQWLFDFLSDDFGSPSTFGILAHISYVASTHAQTQCGQCGAILIRQLFGVSLVDGTSRLSIGQLKLDRQIQSRQHGWIEVLEKKVVCG